MPTHSLKDSIYSKLYNIAVSIIETVTPNDLSKPKIIAAVERALKTLDQPKDYDYKDKLILQLLEAFTVKSSSHAIIRGSSDHREWYEPSKKQRPYWDSYREYIKNDLQFSVDAVAAMDKTTDLIMKNIENPEREGIWDSRGLVVGSVQSGKTSNFIGFINKAIDSGYKKIVVLSGLNNNLRQQTQKRIDEGLLAYDTQASSVGSQIYAGPLAKRRLPLKLKIIGCGTNSKINGDFKKTAEEHLNFHTDEPSIFVVKKNKTVLQNIIKYFLKSPSVVGVKVDPPFKIRGLNNSFPPFVKDKPILVIDDEVDNGSVDTGEQLINEEGKFDPDYDPKTINRLIRTLLNIFHKRTYVGYTATPFANIFIHSQAETQEEGLDLFPKDYIIDLPIPSNHVGLEKIFKTEVVDGNTVEDREIEDNHFFEIVSDTSLYPDDPDCKEGWMPPRHDRYHQPEYNDKNDEEVDIPPSLKEAIMSFILTTACRNYRGYLEDAKSMLIHVSKFVDVQAFVHKQVGDFMNLLRTRMNTKNEKYNETILKFKKLWEEKFFVHKNNTEEKYPSWDELLKDKTSIDFIINEICQNIKLLNGKSNDVLDYKDFLNQNKYGLNTIVIGGDKLSRGLTLEGLSVSYFLRSAKMPMYDTLMQMGRWFGYRMGFEDLCRLYTTDNVIKWFFHISVATDELRNTFRIMAAQGSTPSEFGLKVRTNQNLIITSKTKMRHSRVEQTSFSQEVEEIITFMKNDNVIKSNFHETNKLLLNAKKPIISGDIDNTLHKWKNSFLWKHVKSKYVVAFLNNYKRFIEARSLETAQFAKYIENLNSYGELTDWTICLHGSGSSGKSMKISEKYNVELLLRTPSNQRNPKKISLKVITQSVDELVGLEDSEIDEYKKSFENFKKTHNPETDEKTIAKARRGFARYHRSEKRGLLNLYPIFGITNLSSYKKFRGYKNCNKDCEKGCKKHYIEGHNDINKISSEHLTKYPLMGFQLSFPFSKMGHKAAVEYRVNSVYADHEFNYEN